MTYQDKLICINNGYRDVSQQDKINYFQEEEVGIYHPKNNSVVRVCDDGCVDSFVGKTIGIRLDPNAQSANMFAPKINIFGNRINFLTNPHGLIWNHWKFNPLLYELCRDIPRVRRNFGLKCYMEVWDNAEKKWVPTELVIPPYLKDTTPDNYSPEIRQIISSLGLVL